MAAFMVRGQAGRVGKFFHRLPKDTLSTVCTSESRCLSYCLIRTPQRHAVAVTQAPPSLTIIGCRTASTDTSVEEVKEPEIQLEFKEQFIPITRRSIIRYIMTQRDFLTEEEQGKFESFAVALDSAIINRYHGLLRDLKVLFDPLNPDKDTLSTRTHKKKDLLDNEFWLLQKLASVMSSANFHELPRKFIEQALKEHDARHGVKVSVNTDKYDVMRFWALGKETPPASVTLAQRLQNLVLRRPAPRPIDYFKRVVLAVRLKKDDKLMLKAFKEVPVNALEQLLPDGRIHMSRLDKGLVTAAGVVALGGVLAKVVTLMAHMHVDWMLLVTGITALAGVQAWTTYKNRHLRYVNDLARMLYFKNVANNRGLLTLLVDRAEDEIFKGALLMYTILLTTRPPSALTRGSSEHLPIELGAISTGILELKVNDWVQKHTGQDIHFDCDEAAHLLTELGLLSRDLEDNLHVLPLEAALRNLPQSPQRLVARAEEHDLGEGYDRDAADETQATYKREEAKRRFFGWF